jgi:hypothetical protein
MKNGPAGEKPRKTGVFTSDIEELNDPIPTGLSEAAVFYERWGKLPALAWHYGFDWDSDSGQLRLLMRLAEEVCPGFQVKDQLPRRPVGAPLGKRRLDRHKLVRDVQELIGSQPSLDVFAALKILRKQKEYKNYSAKQLEPRYYDGVRELEEEHAACLEALETLERLTPTDEVLALSRSLKEAKALNFKRKSRTRRTTKIRP